MTKINSLKESKQRGRYLLIVCIIVLVGVMITVVISYIKDKPYRDLEDLISNHLLTAEMCDFNLQKEDGNYYIYLTESKGERIVARYLKKYQEENDIDSALWLISIMPSSNLENAVTETTGNWILKYGQENGQYSTNKPPDKIYRITYYILDDYVIIVGTIGNSYDPTSIHVVEKKSGFWENNTQTSTHYEGNYESHLGVPSDNKCILSHCDFSAQPGKSYCSRHGCCISNCNRQKDPSAHCCDSHNCAYPQCGRHCYDYANSKYCKIHYASN